MPSLDRALRGDVETIVAKALEKDKQRRYQSASDLRADILRYLDDEPIVARPASRMYQLRKFTRRNQGLVGGVAASILILVAGVVVASTLALREADQRRIAETKSEEAKLSAASALTNEKKATAVSAYLRELFHGAMDPIHGGHQVAMSEVIDRAVETIGTRFADQPAVEAELRNEFGAIYHTLGLTERAEPQYEKALTLRRRHLGDDHEDTLDSVNNLGQLHLRQGRFAEAERLLLEASSGRRDSLGADHEKTLVTKMNLGMTLQALGRRDDAERVLRETLESQLRALGEDHSDTMTTMSNLSGLLRRRREFGEAGELAVRTYAGLKRIHGAEHHITLLALGGVARKFKDGKEYDRAESLYREQLAGLRRTMGEEHPDALIATANLASILRKTGKLEEAERMAAELVERGAAALDDDDWRLARFHEEYGEVLDRAGKHNLAEKSFIAAYERCTKTRGRKDRRTVDAIRRLIEFYDAREKPELAARFQSLLEGAGADDNSGDP